MSLNGSLSDMSVLETLQLIGQQRKSGTLEIHSGRQRRELHFQEGMLVHCHAARPEEADPLLEILVGLGWCEAEQTSRLRALSPGQDRREGALQACALSADRFRAAEQLVLQATLDRVLLWDRGHFEFTPRPVPLPGSEPGWNIEQLLLESMRRLDEATDLKSGPLPPTAVFLAAGPAPVRQETAGGDAEVFLTEAVERAVLRSSDGRRTVAQLVQILGLGEWDILTAARALHERGLLRLERAPRAQDPLPRLSPRIVRHPLAPAALLLVLLASLGAGWGIHRVTATTWEPQRRLLQARAHFEEERALRQGLEVYRLRHGSYPGDLRSLSGEGILPADQAGRLEKHGYEVTGSGSGYRLRDPDSGRERIQEAASERSSNDASH